MKSSFRINISAAMRRISLRIAQFQVLDHSDNLINAERIVSLPCAKNPSKHIAELRRAAKTICRDIKSAVVSLPNLPSELQVLSPDETAAAYARADRARRNRRRRETLAQFFSCHQ